MDLKNYTIGKQIFFFNSDMTIVNCVAVHRGPGP
jgi:hypothetical protein